MAKTEYFYRDSAGNIKKYLWCVSCNNKFTQNQLNRDIFELGSGRQIIYYCRQCCTLKGISVESDEYDRGVKPEKNTPITFSDKNVVKETKKEVKKKNKPLSYIDEKSTLEYLNLPLSIYNEDGIKYEEVKSLRGPYFYVLRCSDESLYAGVTTNLSNLEKKHNHGQMANYTKSRLPVKLIAYKLVHSKEIGNETIKEFNKDKIKEIFIEDPQKLQI